MNSGALAGTWGYDPPDEGGTIALEGTTQWPSVLGMTDHGIALGPVELSAFPDSTAVITDLQYGPADTGWFDGWGDEGETADNSTDADEDGFFGAAVGAGLAAGAVRTTTDEDHTATRRDVLKGVGVTLAAAGTAAGAARAQQDLVSVARFDLENPGGLRTRVRNLAPGVMPTDRVYYVLVDGMDYAEFRGGTQQAGDLPPFPEEGKTRSVEIATSPQGFIGDAKAITGEKALSYAFTLGTPADELQQGQQTPITTHPMIREATLRAGAGSVTCEIGDEPIPQITEDRNHERGNYSVIDGTVTYTAGPNPPAGDRAAFTVYAGTVQEIRNDIGQEI